MQVSVGFYPDSLVESKAVKVRFILFLYFVYVETPPFVRKSAWLEYPCFINVVWNYLTGEEGEIAGIECHLVAYFGKWSFRHVECVIVGGEI